MMILYRHFSADSELLYVGITHSLYFAGRLARHRQRSFWFPLVDGISIEFFRSSDDCRVAEMNSIKTEQPLFNCLHNLDMRQTDVQGHRSINGAHLTRYRPNDYFHPMAYKLDAAGEWLKANTPKGYGKRKKREARQIARLGRDEVMRRAVIKRDTQTVPGVKRTEQSRPLQSQQSGLHSGPVNSGPQPKT